MHDDIAAHFGLAPLGTHTPNTYQGQPVDPQDDPEAWRQDALCHPARRPAGTTIADWVDRWFPGQGEPVTHLRAICDACPALEPCRADALARNDLGFQGGLTQRERQRRRNPRPPSQQRAAVARYVALGWTDERIGRRVGLSRRGVMYHRQQLGLKKDAHGRLVAGEDAA